MRGVAWRTEQNRTGEQRRCQWSCPIPEPSDRTEVGLSSPRSAGLSSPRSAGQWAPGLELLPSLSSAVSRLWQPGCYGEG